MDTIPIVFRITQGLYALLNQQVAVETLIEKGLARAVIEVVAHRDHRNWEEVASEFRKRHGLPVGTGYNKESE